MQDLWGKGRKHRAYLGVCKKAKEEMDEGWIREVEEKGLVGRGENFEKNWCRVMIGDPIESICHYSRRFEKIARSRSEKGIVSGRRV